ncbi:MAG: hypothetical protein HYR85_02145 [Planctomycetes bacterium]|nr:hypothetical protein [Planctomycetota bacterium]MBI3848394.1 hypothetical protein [Planctomycetota bacterium]
MTTLHRFALVAGIAASALAQPQDAREFAKAQAEAQKAWYERSHERPDLVPGAWEVVRFPTAWQPKPRYKHDPRDARKILNPDFYCSRCVKEGRIPAATDRPQHRLLQRDEPQVLKWMERELKVERWTLIEDDEFKLWSDLPGFNTRALKQCGNPFLKEELTELGDLFPEVDDKTVVLDDHRRAHLYLIRAHRLQRDFWWLAGTNEKECREKYSFLGPYMGMNNKMEIFMLDSKRDYEKLMDWYLGVQVVADGICWHHLTDRAMLLAMHGDGQEDPQTENYFFHRMMHNYIDAYRMFAFKMPAWFQMGMGAFAERRECAKYNCFCFSEGTMPRVLYEEKWLPKVKRMVAKGTPMSFVEEATATEYGALSPEYHMIAYSQICYLFSLGPEKFKVFLNALKEKKTEESIYAAQVRGFQSAYGITMLQFDEGWRRWVLAIYPDV